MNPSLIKKPAAYLPIAMSLTALALVLLHAARYGIIHEADEGPSALEGDHLLTQFGGNAHNNFRSSFASDVPGQVRGQTTPPLSFEGRAAKLRPPRITPPPIWAAAKTKDTLLSRAAQRNHRDPQAVPLSIRVSAASRAAFGRRANSYASGGFGNAVCGEQTGPHKRTSKTGPEVLTLVNLG